MRKSLLVALCTVGVAACGGSGPSPTFNPGVAGNKKINTLTPAEQQTICDSFEAKFTGAEFIDQQCRIVSVLQVSFTADDQATDAQLRMQCATAYAECKTQAGADGGSKPTCNPPGATCTATVDQLTACVNDVLAYLDRLDAPACDKLTRATLTTTSAPDAGPPDPTSSAACKAYQAACPDDDIGATMGMPKS